MGARYCQLWVKPSADAAREALDELFAEPPPPGRWIRVSEDDFDADALDPARRLCSEEAAACGEALYLAMYDGPAGELCGSFAYERVVDGAVARALLFAPGDDGQLRWLRVEGPPEPWETPLLAARLDAQLRRWREQRRDLALPAPTPAEEAAARAACLRLTLGEPLPFLNEYELVAAVHDAHGLSIPPG